MLCDLHAHILPHMDHGCRHTATAVSQLDMMQANGVDIVAATSHFYPQDTIPEVYLEKRRESVRHLLSTIGDRPRPRILLGAEVLICPGLENMEGLRELCYAGTDILLLEMPLTSRRWDSALYQTIHEIGQMGIRPLLAHVERYPATLIDELFSGMDLHGQVNADALTCIVKPKHILRWMETGRIVALGSDVHGSDPKACNTFKKVASGMPAHIRPLMQATDRWFSHAELI